MDTVSLALISKALSGLSTRYEFTSHNIANANTENYSPVSVSFESALKAAYPNGVDSINAVSPSIASTTMGEDGGELRLDLELATASQTAMRFGALVNVLGRQMSMTRVVVTGGR